MTPLRVDSRCRRRPAARALVATALAAILALLGSTAAHRDAAAHPLGNFSVNQYSRIEALTTGLRLSYVLDLAELPTVQDRPRVDANGDGAVDDRERDAYLTAKLAEIAPSLSLTAGGIDVPLRLVDRAISFPPGQAGLATTRVEATFAATLPAGASGAGGLVYRDDYATDRQGWREIVVTHGSDIRLDRSDAPATDRSNALRSYPVDPLRNQPDQRAASFAYDLAPGAPAAATSDRASLTAAPADPLAALVARADQTGAGLLIALALAAAWGAVHALSPGHGKTLVGAYLVGARGTPRHALALGVTVTITHTAGVIALGAIILLASRTIVPERFYPWLSLLSGAMVAALGASILWRRLRGLPVGHHHAHDHPHDHAHGHSHDHDHGHDHPHAHDPIAGHVHAHDGLPPHSHLPVASDGEAITWRSLLALGVSGGLLPCPSALLALLGAVAVGQAAYGLLLVVAFSVGLAGTLTGVGLLVLFAGRLLERRVAFGRLPSLARYTPVVGAAAVTLSGLVIVVRALAEVRFP